MTFAEVFRAIESKQRVIKLEEQRRASFDYIQADLIGRSIARVYSSANTMPPIEEAYSSLFDKEEVAKIRQKQAAEMSAIKLKQFAQSFNKRFEGASINDE